MLRRAQETARLHPVKNSGTAIRRIDTHGVITTVAGSGYGAGGSGGYSGDGGAATNASLWFPSGVVVDAVGNLFIADQKNQRVRKVNTNGVITAVAGNGVAGFSGDGGPATAASLWAPSSPLKKPRFRNPPAPQFPEGDDGHHH